MMRFPIFLLACLPSLGVVVAAGEELLSNYQLHGYINFLESNLKGCNQGDIVRIFQNDEGGSCSIYADLVANLTIHNNDTNVLAGQLYNGWVVNTGFFENLAAANWENHKYEVVGTVKSKMLLEKPEQTQILRK